MANQEQLAILKSGVEKWNQWREENPSVKLNLIGANLIGADLSYADLSGANLIGADLSYADLSGADLSGAYLLRTSLLDANLFGADLSDADLRGADLSGADLLRTSLLVAKVTQEQLKTAKNVHSIFLKENTESSRKLENEIANYDKKLKDKEKELQELQAKTQSLTDKQEKQKNDLEKEVEKIKLESQHTKEELKKFKEEQDRRVKDSTDFKKRLENASEEIKKPYKYLSYEIWFENILCIVLFLVAIVAFFLLFRYIQNIDYNNRLVCIYEDKDFNFYKLFFIISPVIFYLGLFSTFITMALKRRQNVRELESKQQEINHITGILSAYTTIREDEEIIHAKEFAREAIKDYLKKVMNAKDTSIKEEDENADFISSMRKLLKKEFLDFREEIKKGDG